MTFLEVRDLRKVFQKRGAFLSRHSEPHVAVDNVSFEIAKGETLALVGESGAGKSTVGRMVMQLIERDAGEIMCEGVDIREFAGRRKPSWFRRAQMIFQDPYSSFDPKITIEQSVAEPLLLHTKESKSDRHRHALDLLERVGLGAHHGKRYPRELSGGQLQRAAVARALTSRPELIVCDEPVAALDVSIRAQVLNLLTDLQNELGMSYLFVSHDLSLVEVFADRVAVMQGGRIVETATAAELYTHPQHEYTKALLAAIPKVPVPVDEIDPELGRGATAEAV